MDVAPYCCLVTRREWNVTLRIQYAPTSGVAQFLVATYRAIHPEKASQGDDQQQELGGGVSVGHLRRLCAHA